MELSPYGSFINLIYDQATFPAGSFPTQLIVAWLCDMCEAIAYIHGKGVTHHNIRAENFLVFPKLRLKLCNFGHHRVPSSAEIISQSQPQGPIGASDIHSFAIVAIQVLTCNPPNIDVSLDSQIISAVSTVPGLDEQQRQHLLALLLECLDPEPTKRPTAKKSIAFSKMFSPNVVLTYALIIMEVIV